MLCSNLNFACNNDLTSQTASVQIWCVGLFGNACGTFARTFYVTKSCFGEKMSLLEIKHLDMSFGDKVLLKDANFVVNKGDKMGVVGVNGAGKSTLLKIVVGDILYDKAEYSKNPKVKIGYLDQQALIDSEKTIEDYLRESFASLYEANARLEKLYEDMAFANENKLLQLTNKTEELTNFLQDNQFYAIDSQIGRVVGGLGISAFGLKTKVKTLSGGQRARVRLAKLLLEKPNLILLDEPTNFLDAEHIEWLADYLKNFDGTFVVVSHDEKFLAQVTNCIVDVDNQVLTRYNEPYSQFLRHKEQDKAQQQKNYDGQQRKIDSMTKLIDRFRYKASKASMVQSRIKVLEKMEKIEPPTEHAKPTFLFCYKPLGSKILLRVNNLQIGYQKPLLKKSINLVLERGQKLAITGFNGIGKSTFLKTLSGIIPTISGDFEFATNTVIGYYEQDNIFEFPTMTPTQYILSEYPNLTESEARSHLAQCGVTSKQATEKICTLSGGEQAKTKICKLTLFPCNILILDEPTNHLDHNAIAQLSTAIKKFDGTVLFVSHDKDFVKDNADIVLSMEKLLK